jgi:MoxR-like ATPase
MSTLTYRKIFDPRLDGSGSLGVGEYVYNDAIVLAINAALITGRPILVRGPSGTGKSSLAKAVAAALDWNFESEVITSEHTAQDLKWKVDNVGRLAKAQVGTSDPDELALRRFIVPGPLWWAFERASATEQFALASRQPRAANRDRDNVVLLLDEIDKADPDLPNGLLEPLEEGTFTVPEIGSPIERWRPPKGQPDRLLVFVTSNNERRLPDAFLRRCLDLKLERPAKERMKLIAAAHELIDPFDVVWDALFGDTDEMSLGTAEFLDTLQAFTELRAGTDEGALLTALTEVTAWKHDRTQPGHPGSR